MKKIISITLFVLAILLIHTTVFADMDAPSVEPYIAIVTNVDGMPYFKLEFDEETQKSYLYKEGSLNYGDEVTIQYEETFNDQLYGYFTQESLYGYIKLDEVEIKATDKAKERKVDYTSPIYFKVLKSDGVLIHKGPADAYETIGRPIPFGTQITAYSFHEYGSDPWFFITYQGVEGYICELNGALGQRSKYIKSIKAPKEINVYATTKSSFVSGEEPEIVTTLKPNTVIASAFYDVDAWSRMYYIENGKSSGYVSMYDITTEPVQLYKETLEIPEGGLALHEYADEESPILIDNIPEGTTFTFIYRTSEFEYEQPGWVNISYEGKDGWILIDYEHLHFNYDEAVEEEPEPEVVEEPVDNTVVPIEEPTKIEVNSTATLPQIALMCLAVGIIIALTAIVTMKLVNKKKDNGDNNSTNNNDNSNNL